MSESEKNTNADEESVVAKVTELMETLDEVEKFETVDKNFKKFALIVVSSIVILLVVSTLLPFSRLLAPFDPSQRFLLNFLPVIIPVTGVSIGILFIRSKIAAVKSGEWKDELKHGFPSALKILSEMKWESSLETVSSSGLGYAMYGLVKGAAYWIITYFVLGLTFNLTTYILIHQVAVLGGASVWISLLIAIGYLKIELTRRFNEIRAIDKLFWELRRISYEISTG
jgi:hypothetical protein